MMNHSCSKYRRFLGALVIFLVSTTIPATKPSSASLWKTFNSQKVQNLPAKDVDRFPELWGQSQTFPSPTANSLKLFSYVQRPEMIRSQARISRSSDNNMAMTPNNPAALIVSNTYDHNQHFPQSAQSQQVLHSKGIDHSNNYAHSQTETEHIIYGYQPYGSHSYHQHHGHMEDDEELVEIEDKVFSKTIVATKALKIGKFVFTFFMVLVVLILAGLAKLGISLSPVVLPLALLPIGVIALLLFVPLFLIFVPVVATGLGGGKRRRRSVLNQFDDIDLNIPIFDVHEILKKIKNSLETVE